MIFKGSCVALVTPFSQSGVNFDAFEKLLDSLFVDRAWDISSDISVLNTMLAQEGLKEDDFTLNNK